MKMTHIKVRNMKSPRGNDVPNQFVIETEDGIYFQSYQSVIAFKPYCPKINTHIKIVLDREDWDYSVTTGKYRNQFLGEGIAETRAKIKSGEYKLANLN